jgi:hypothetical protein
LQKSSSDDPQLRLIRFFEVQGAAFGKSELSERSSIAITSTAIEHTSVEQNAIKLEGSVNAGQRY